MKTLPRVIALAVLLAVVCAAASATLPPKSTEILWDRYGNPAHFRAGPR